jgi:predicted kinase
MAKPNVKPTLTMTKGLPGSGKSTWAEQAVLDAEPGAIVRVNKDLLRTMLNAGSHQGKTEKLVLRTRDVIVTMHLADGVSVIVDDTNLAPQHEARLRQLAEEAGARFALRDFTDVDLEVCIERDRLRARTVGEREIRKMWAEFIAPSPQRPEAPAGSPLAVICDIDGTLAIKGDRSPFDWLKVGGDTPNRAVVEAVRRLASTGVEILYTSGRDEVCREITRAWLDEHVGVDGPLFMRRRSDMRKDSIVKRELFDTNIRGRYHVLFVLDDRNQVVHTWRHELGLDCFQVAPGDF